MNNIEINQTVSGPEELLEDGEIVIEEGAFDGFEGKTINITDSSDGGSDVEAGIQFIYHMREHLIDIGIATVYGLSVYAIFLWITKKIKG
tara:strand:- start:792 stop:1061 length:270 start_codon:yes stop_codon:yes gene_type:complete